MYTHSPCPHTNSRVLVYFVYASWKYTCTHTGLTLPIPSICVPIRYSADTRGKSKDPGKRRSSKMCTRKEGAGEGDFAFESCSRASISIKDFIERIIIRTRVKNNNFCPVRCFFFFFFFPFKRNVQFYARETCVPRREFRFVIPYTTAKYIFNFDGDNIIRETTTYFLE